MVKTDGQLSKLENMRTLQYILRRMAFDEREPNIHPFE